MEYFNSLYNRLDGNNEKQMQLFLIRENAINEIHNANVLAQLHTNPSFTEKWTKLTPEQRVVEKVSIAKSVGKSHVPHTMPAPKTDGEMAFIIQVNYEPAFNNCISLCIQGGLEGLYKRQIYLKNKSKIMDYNIIVTNTAQVDLSKFKENIQILNSVYDCFNIKIVEAAENKSDDETNKPNNKEEKEPPKKKGFLSKLFKK